MSHVKVVLGRGDGAVSEWDPAGRASPSATAYSIGQRHKGFGIPERQGGSATENERQMGWGESGYATVKKSVRDPAQEEPAGASVERVTINALQWGETYRGQDKSRRLATLWEPRAHNSLVAQTSHLSDTDVTGHRPLEASTANGETYLHSPAGVHENTNPPNKNIGSHSAEIHSWIDAQPRQGAVRPKHWATSTTTDHTTINDTYYNQHLKI